MTEKACIFNIQKFSLHDGPGIRTVVFFKGCPLKCYWCANPESQDGKPEKMWDTGKKQLTTVGEYKNVDEILHEALKDEPFYAESGGGVTLSGGEVLYQAGFAIQLLKKLKEHGIHTACETTGYAPATIFAEFLQYVDLLYFDVKHYDSTKHLKGVGVGNQRILENLAYAIQSQKPLIVRIPVIPDFNHRLEDAEQFAQLFVTLGIKKIELLPFHQFGEKKYEYLQRDYALQNIPQLHTEDLKEYADVFVKKGIDCLVR